MPLRVVNIGEGLHLRWMGASERGREKNPIGSSKEDERGQGNVPIPM